MSEFSKGFKSRRPNKSFYDPAFASGWWVYGTLILSWCLDLLPLSHLPYFPSFLVLTLVFWTIHQPQRIYYWLAFLFGLLTDADTGAVFGQHARAPELVKQHCAVHLLDSYFLYSRDSSDD